MLRLLLFFCCALLAGPLPAQPAPPLALQAVPAAILPTEFYVAAVRDERSAPGPVAQLLARPCGSLWP